MRTFDIVVTTIFEPEWLEGYLRNFERHGHVDEVTIRIICDRKSPASVYEAAERAKRDGFKVDCPDLEEQEQYLRLLGLPEDFIPWNSDNRRNIGYLRAWEHGADVLISIDDDNYCRDDSDFIASHSVVGAPAGDDPGAEFVGGAPWFNLCELLHGYDGPTIWARGFPYSERHDRAPVQIGALPAEVGASTVAANAGLWIDDPDVDAVTRLAQRPLIDRAEDRNLVIASDTWTPVNTQNTAVHRDAIPAYYYVRMGFPVKGMVIDRFGDIWSGYFLQRCAQQAGEVVRVGAPVADHRRTTHNLFKDLYQELAGIVLTEDLVPWLRETSLTSTSYLDAYTEIADAIEAEAERFDGFLWDEGGSEFLKRSAGHMRTWLSAIRVLSGA